MEITGMLEEILEALVAAGLYNNKSEAVRDAIRRLGEKIDLNNIALRVYMENRDMSFTRVLSITRLGFKEAVVYFIKHGFAPELGVVDKNEIESFFNSSNEISDSGIILDLTSLEVFMETGLIEHLPKIASITSLIIPKSLEDYIRQIPLRYGLLYRKMLSLPGFRVEKATVSSSSRGWLSMSEAEALKIAKKNNAIIISCDMRFRRQARIRGVKIAPGASLALYMTKKTLVPRGFWRVFLARAASIPVYMPEAVDRLV